MQVGSIRRNVERKFFHFKYNFLICVVDTPVMFDIRAPNEYSEFW